LTARRVDLDTNEVALVGGGSRSPGVAAGKLAGDLVGGESGRVEPFAGRRVQVGPFSQQPVDDLGRAIADQRPGVVTTDPSFQLAGVGGEYGNLGSCLLYHLTLPTTERV
jgi:hypothetical protein